MSRPNFFEMFAAHNPITADELVVPHLKHEAILAATPGQLMMVIPKLIPESATVDYIMINRDGINDHMREADITAESEQTLFVQSVRDIDAVAAEAGLLPMGVMYIQDGEALHFGSDTSPQLGFSQGTAARLGSIGVSEGGLHLIKYADDANVGLFRKSEDVMSVPQAREEAIPASHELQAAITQALDDRRTQFQLFGDIVTHDLLISPSKVPDGIGGRSVVMHIEKAEGFDKLHPQTGYHCVNIKFHPVDGILIKRIPEDPDARGITGVNLPYRPINEIEGEALLRLARSD